MSAYALSDFFDMYVIFILNEGFLSIVVYYPYFDTNIILWAL